MPLKPVLLPFGKTIYQTTQGQQISTDNTYLVELILQMESERPHDVIDLGCGNGILAIMLAHYRPEWNIKGLEIQPHLAQLAKNNSLLLEQQNVRIISQDIREWDTSEKYDIILSNPPYYPSNSGKLSPNQEKAISTHEINCTMLDILTFINKFLKSSGKAYLIYPSERALDMRKFAKKVDLIINDEFFFNKLKKEKIVFSLSRRI